MSEPAIMTKETIDRWRHDFTISRDIYFKKKNKNFNTPIKKEESCVRTIILKEISIIHHQKSIHVSEYQNQDRTL